MTYRLLIVVIAVAFSLVAPMAPMATHPFTFSGVKFPLPISASLAALGLTTPTPIQKAAIGPLTSGLSAILHAETGTFCYCRSDRLSITRLKFFSLIRKWENSCVSTSPHEKDLWRGMQFYTTASNDCCPNKRTGYTGFTR